MRRQFRQGLVEIGLRRRRDAIGILAEENLVKVQFKNPFLVQRLFQPRGQDDLLDLALDLAVVQVLL